MSAPVFYLPQTGSTNLWAKAHPRQAAGVWAVYTCDQTAGRGRLGRAWAGAAGQALYYTAVLPWPPAKLPALGLLASLLLRRVLADRYGLAGDGAPAVKWPNDLLLHGKKVAGILCEGVPGQDVTVCGIGVNLSQPQRFFEAAALPWAASLAALGIDADAKRDAAPLAAALTDAFAAQGPVLCREGFAPFCAAYRACCLNLGRRVRWDGGAGTALDVDEAGRLLVQPDTGGAVRLFTGEVSLQGIYGAP